MRVPATSGNDFIAWKKPVNTEFFEPRCPSWQRFGNRISLFTRKELSDFKWSQIALFCHTPIIINSSFLPIFYPAGKLSASWHFPPACLIMFLENQPFAAAYSLRSMFLGGAVNPSPVFKQRSAFYCKNRPLCQRICLSIVRFLISHLKSDPHCHSLSFFEA